MTDFKEGIPPSLDDIIVGLFNLQGGACCSELSLADISRIAQVSECDAQIIKDAFGKDPKEHMQDFLGKIRLNETSDSSRVVQIVNTLWNPIELVRIANRKDASMTIEGIRYLLYGIIDPFLMDIGFGRLNVWDKRMFDYQSDTLRAAAISVLDDRGIHADPRERISRHLDVPPEHSDSWGPGVPIPID